ncbi:MAG TPA: BNR-4 repeat-containing protein [Desulfomonilaceae bacterium]|nr:BNR-4 repeat-containing protein [Desulfomonilaceae bacterium]
MQRLLALGTTLFIAVWVLTCESEPPKGGEFYPIFSNDGAWCWFQDPRAVYVEGKNKRTYAGWMTHDGQLQIGAYDHQTGSIQSFTLKKDWDIDDHNTLSILVLPDRRLMVFYARHNQTGLFCRTSLKPENILEWGKELVVSDTPAITYSHPAFLKAENRFYVFWRGPSWKPTFASSADAEHWTQSEILIEEPGHEAPNIRPYTKIVSDGISTIHFAFTDGHPDSEPRNSIYYLRYQTGTFYKADGSKVGNMGNLPVLPSKSDVVYNGKDTGVRAWVWDIALDAKGYPVIAYTRFPSTTDHRYHYARWNGKAWFDTEIVSGGKWFPQTRAGQEEREPYYSGGMALNHNNPSLVFLSRPINGVFEIERWQTPDEGKSWTSSSITRNSRLLNVRPIVPMGYTGAEDHVLWMHGQYVHYTDYRTDIRMTIEGNATMPTKALVGAETQRR